MKIHINDTEVTLKRTFRSVIAYEQATGKGFNPTTVSDTILYFYCVIIASDTDLTVTYDDFITWLDSHETALNEFTQWLNKTAEADATLSKKKTKTAKENK